MERFRTRRTSCDSQRATVEQCASATLPHLPGPEDTYASYGRAWANLSNTPFRYYKRWVHEGGIATPLIAHWPNGRLRQRSILHEPFQLTDVVPTVLDAVGTPIRRRPKVAACCQRCAAEPSRRSHCSGSTLAMPQFVAGRGSSYASSPNRGSSTTSAPTAPSWDEAARHPELVAELSADWAAWASRVGVIPWERVQELYRREGGEIPRGEPIGSRGYRLRRRLGDDEASVREGRSPPFAFSSANGEGERDMSDGTRRGQRCGDAQRGMSRRKLLRLGLLSATAAPVLLRPRRAAAQIGGTHPARRRRRRATSRIRWSSRDPRPRRVGPTTLSFWQYVGFHIEVQKFIAEEYKRGTIRTSRSRSPRTRA